MDKIVVKYSPQVLTNAQGESKVFARITERPTYSCDQLIAYALESQFVRGQAADIKGTWNGLLSAAKSLLEKGAAVNCDWFRVETTVKGKLDENRRITSENTLATMFRALSDLKLDISSFTFQNVESPEAVVKVSNIMAIGGEKGYVEVGKATGVYGANLYYNSALGDKVTVNWAGLATPIELTPTEADWAHMEFATISQFATVPSGTPINFTFYLHGGVVGSQTQIVSKVVELINPNCILTGVQDADGQPQVTHDKGLTIFGSNVPLTFTANDKIVEKNGSQTVGTATLPSLIEDGAITSHDGDKVVISNLLWTPLSGTVGNTVEITIGGSTLTKVIL